MEHGRHLVMDEDDVIGEFTALFDENCGGGGGGGKA